MSALINYDVQEPDAGIVDRLVVVCHGYGKTRASVADLVKALRTEYPSAGIMNVEHAGKDLFSNADPIVVADELNAVIGAAVDRYGVTTVVLVGHSIGALLLRKAYVFARGLNQDSVSPVERHRWALCVDKMVFLAAFNRGISILERTSGRSTVQFFAIRFAYAIARLTRTGSFIRRFERGGRFISNLRLQWLAATPVIAEASSDRAIAMPSVFGRSLGPLDVKALPLVTQLVGIEDEYIGQNESNDLTVCGSFIRRNLPNTNHANIVDFSDTPDGRFRRDEFVRALRLGPPDSPTPSQRTTPGVERIVFIMHGIRDFGFWVPGLAKRLTSRAIAVPIRVEPITSSYGYFSLLSFILWSDRQRNVRWFMDQLTEAVAKNPQAKIDFVGHSNGTYILASALRDYVTTKFNNVVFAGSVVRRDFPWDAMKVAGRIEAVRNYVGSADWVVGWFPHFFEFLGGLLKLQEARYLDIGGAGFLGFTSSVTAEHQVTFIEGGHGAAIVEKNWNSIADYILKPSTERARDLEIDNQSAFVGLMSRMCWLPCIAGLSAVVTLIAAVGFFAYVLSHSLLIGCVAVLAIGLILYLLSQSF